LQFPAASRRAVAIARALINQPATKLGRRGRPEPREANEEIVLDFSRVDTAPGNHMDELTHDVRIAQQRHAESAARTSPRASFFVTLRPAPPYLHPTPPARPLSLSARIIRGLPLDQYRRLLHAGYSSDDVNLLSHRTARAAVVICGRLTRQARAVRSCCCSNGPAGQLSVIAR